MESEAQVFQYHILMKKASHAINMQINNVAFLSAQGACIEVTLYFDSGTQFFAVRTSRVIRRSHGQILGAIYFLFDDEQFPAGDGCPSGGSQRIRGPSPGGSRH
jgi:hypothetical protein